MMRESSMRQSVCKVNVLCNVSTVLKEQNTYACTSYEIQIVKFGNLHSI